MNIDSITNGLVLDHIQAGRAMQIYAALRLDELDCVVAVIKNVKSRKMGKKDLIKIDEMIGLDLDALGFIDQNITINVIREGVRVEKKQLRLPEKLVNVLRCKNPRCITTTEQEVDQVFRLVRETPPLYRCAYCETACQNL
ncbi:MAG: aspartate carbamoyltransferase regulatory subunit [Oscillospiraceae bacterium]|nr:aspartate carbamoyltransferase regulatory subunit [Oscillospiraceae bacterium]